MRVKEGSNGEKRKKTSSEAGPSGQTALWAGTSGHAATPDASVCLPTVTSPVSLLGDRWSILPAGQPVSRQASGWCMLWRSSARKLERSGDSSRALVTSVPACHSGALVVRGTETCPAFTCLYTTHISAPISQMTGLRHTEIQWPVQDHSAAVWTQKLTWECTSVSSVIGLWRSSGCAAHTGSQGVLTEFLRDSRRGGHSSFILSYWPPAGSCWFLVTLF